MNEQPEDSITPREREVWGLLAEFNTNREIAALLTISHRTAEAHVAHLIKKLGVSNRREAARAWGVINR